MPALEWARGCADEERGGWLPSSQRDGPDAKPDFLLSVSVRTQMLVPRVVRLAFADDIERRWDAARVSSPLKDIHIDWRCVQDAIDAGVDGVVVFRPKNERHAIDAAAFVIGLREPLDQAALDQIAAAHDRWKAELPKLARPGASLPLPIQMGNNLRLNFGAGLTFSAFKRDGSVDWQLKIEESQITVLCRNYTRWSSVWATAKKYIAGALDAAEGHRSISRLAMEYANQFAWDGSEESYRAADLLRADTGFVPTGIINRGPLFHFHQGWFRADGLPAGERLLERVNVDGHSGAPFDTPTVRITLTLQLEIGDDGLPISAEDFQSDESTVSVCVNFLHASEKQLLANFLAVPIQDRIALHAPDDASVGSR